ncbi:MAG: GNAT family N-acetyltransferase [Pseudomonadota bacterium]|nr:GNAT family N-acetyltransferase [Pseudomonadota bacterium]
MTYSIRPITEADNTALAHIIRAVMPEFGADGPGFAIHDAEVSKMSFAYAAPGCAYFVVESEGRVLGGGGVAPLANAEPDICELRKMYFLAELRRQGAGSALMQQCLEAARTLGFKRCYLETLTGMDDAKRLYRKTGFRSIAQSLGATGHFGCDSFFILDL